MKDMEREYRYSLDKSSKKFTCPNCGKKTFVKYVDNESGSYLDGDFGRCDRENNCNYHKTPKGEIQSTIQAPSQKERSVIVFPNGEVSPFFKDLSSPFHSYCRSLGITDEHLAKWYVGTTGKYTSFGLLNGVGTIINSKQMPYGANGSRLKGEDHKTFYLGRKWPIRLDDDERYDKCLYGLHLYNKEQKTVIVESEKTAVLGSFFYSSYNWLATGGNSGVTPEKMDAILGAKEKIIYLSDNDKAGTENKIVEYLRKLNEINGRVIICNPFQQNEHGYDVADWIRDNPELITGDLENDLGIGIIEQAQILQDKAVEITFSFQPTVKEAIVSLNNVRTCSIGNIMGIVANAGTGKSQTCETIAAAFLNPDCDAFGFSVNLPNDKYLVYIDGERTHEDCKYGFNRIGRRIDLQNNPELVDGDRMRRFSFQSFITIPSKKKRKEELERIINEFEVGLIIIDDLTCLVTDPNDIKESDELMTWLVSMANSKGFGLICTIHPNPNSTKPRGHIGTRLWHVCESMYLLTRATDDKEVRRLTTDFDMSKTRSDTDINESNYRWSEESNMFMTCDYSMRVTGSKVIDYKERFSKVFDGYGKEVLKYKEIIESYRTAYEVSVSTANRHLNDAIDLDILKREGKGKNSLYQMFDYVPF